MSWILLAVIGHLVNAAAFVIDKVLLSSSFKRSATYAAMIGGLMLLALLATPWVKSWPSLTLLPVEAGFGGLFVLGLWAFFSALKRAEASRVVPIVGSLIPLFTFVGTSTLLGERLSLPQILGFALLLTATWILTQDTGRLKFDRQVLGRAILAAALFAAASVCGKFAFNHGSLLGVFVVSRVFSGLVGILLALLTSARWEFISMFSHKATTTRPAGAVLWAAIGQVFGTAGFLLVNVALAWGSAALVNALQAVQYTALVLVAWFGGAHLRRLLKEHVTPTIVILKSLAIICVALGLAMISF